MSRIEIKNATKRFGATTALDNITLNFESGRIYGLLGRNGAGKSTLLNLITGRLFADKGEITLDGQPILENDAALSQIYYMSEKNLFPENMRVRDALHWTGEFYPGYDAVYAKELAGRFGLATNKKIKTLSTGYGSIFKIIAALSSGAPFVLLDEPVLGLDANHREMFYRELIEAYTKNPRCFIISTHLIEEAAGIIEEVSILKDGRLLLNESTEQVLSRGYAVSGPAGAVDAYATGKKLLGSDAIGGLKTAYVLGKPEGALPDGLELSRLDLQKLFIKLTNA